MFASSAAADANMARSMPVLFARTRTQTGRQRVTNRPSWSRLYSTSPLYPNIPVCPLPTCECQHMPTGLDIDYKRPLSGTVPPYSDHLLLHTGTYDWPSKIEDDQRYPLAHDMKLALKRKIIRSLGMNRTNILVNNSSLSTQATEDQSMHLVSLMKLGIHVHVQRSGVKSFMEWLTSTATFSENMSAASASQQAIQNQFNSIPITEIMVLICGHGERDMRCGIMGPLLQQEFDEKLRQSGIAIRQDPISLNETGNSRPGKDQISDVRDVSARIGLISHIGGHVFAGNVIIYIPSTEAFTSHPLSGRGVWYGRVQPQHVEGIVQKTVKEGVVIQELLRGVM
jgi:Sucrase/ferredoxin-like